MKGENEYRKELQYLKSKRRESAKEIRRSCQGSGGKTRRVWCHRNQKKKVFQEGGPGSLCAILLHNPSKNSKVTIGFGHLKVMATMPRAISLSHLSEGRQKLRTSGKRIGGREGQMAAIDTTSKMFCSRVELQTQSGRGMWG